MGSERILYLRKENLKQENVRMRSFEGEYLYMKRWLETKNTASSSLVRRAMSKAYMLENSTPVYTDGELTVGKPCYRELNIEEEKEFELMQKYSSNAMFSMSGMDAHMAIDYEKLLSIGIDGIKAEIIEKQQALDLEIMENIPKNEFYKAALISLDGVLAYCENYKNYMLKLANNEENLLKKQELLQIAKNLENVPRSPAKTFYEAMQSLHFVTFCLEGLYQLGRPDRYLYKYYIDDIKNGILTKEFAQELINCEFILLNEYIPKGLAIGLMVGGRDKDGRDITNELSFMFIEAIRQVRLVYPGVSLCYNSDSPKEILQLSCEVLGEGLSHPAIFNDDIVIKGLESYGLDKHHSCEYIHSTCVEITPIKSSGVWVASPYINLTAPLLEIMGVSGNEYKAVPKDISQLKKLYKQRLSEKIKEEAIQQNIEQMERAKHGGDPLVSCFVDDCIERGMDIDEGGAKYNFVMPSFVGLSNVTDSIWAINEVVFNKKMISYEEFSQVLKSNFEDNLGLQKYIEEKVIKYGNDEDEIDDLVKEISQFIISETTKHKSWRGDQFIPSLFCWIMHDMLGQNTMATPDGRKAGFPLGDGSGPAQGREKNGPTASVLSSTKWEHHKFIGGIAVNVKFSKNMFDKNSVDRLINLINTYIKRGGFEIQVNVVDHETLLKAQKNPEEYKDLIVRIGGYSDYFVNLTPTMQAEVLLRTQHEL